jgi:fatty acid desaturase
LRAGEGSAGWLGSALILLAQQTWWQALPLALSVGFAATGVGFNIHHDSNHGAFACSFRANRALGFVLNPAPQLTG